jgi:hypothetical protein
MLEIPSMNTISISIVNVIRINKDKETMKMKKIQLTITSLAALVIVISVIGVRPVTATRATPDRGNGCHVRIGDGANDYAFDPACETHDVLKLDDDGGLDFYVYQDHGQLPAGGWFPSQPYRSTFEQCFEFGSIGVICGTVKESVTPSGEYKSSFKSH